jgi:hypothetical protein
VRQVNESIESLTPTAGTGPAVPLAFRWRGRRYVVGSVLAHWVETGAWWRPEYRAPKQPPPAGAPADPERWLWRVEVDSRGRQTGVFDLCLDRDRGHWSLHAIYD